MQRVQNVFRSSFVAVEFMGDVRFAVHRAARCQRHHFAIERIVDRFFHAESHTADLLDEEFAAAGGAFVMGQDVADPDRRQ